MRLAGHPRQSAGRSDRDFDSLRVAALSARADRPAARVETRDRDLRRPGGHGGDFAGGARRRCSARLPRARATAPLAGRRPARRRRTARRRGARRLRSRDRAAEGGDWVGLARRARRHEAAVPRGSRRAAGATVTVRGRGEATAAAKRSLIARSSTREGSDRSASIAPLRLDAGAGHARRRLVVTACIRALSRGSSCSACRPRSRSPAARRRP